MALFNRTVQIAYIIQIQCTLQGKVLLISLEHLILLDSRFQFQRIASFGYLE